MCTTSMRGEAILRLLSLPFSDPKKIEQVLGYELESQILTEIDELVYDSVLANPKHKDQPNPSADAPGRVIAVAAPRAEVRNIIDALAAVRAEPKIVGAAALSYAALRAPQEDELVRGIIDIGHQHTHVCVVQSSTALFARSIALGSADITHAIMDAFKQSEEAATKLKHEHAKLVATGGTPLDQCVDTALLPLLRELKSTLAAVRATGSPAVQRLYMTGGGARLRGLLPRLEAELELPVEQLTLSVDDPFIGEGVEFEPVTRTTELPGQALGLAIAAAASVPQANLRKGELAYKVDYAFLRGKARYLLVATIAIIAFATVNAMASSARDAQRSGRPRGATQSANERSLRRRAPRRCRRFGRARTRARAAAFHRFRASPRTTFSMSSRTNCRRTRRARLICSSSTSNRRKLFSKALRAARSRSTRFKLRSSRSIASARCSPAACRRSRRNRRVKRAKTKSQSSSSSST